MWISLLNKLGQKSNVAQMFVFVVCMHRRLDSLLGQAPASPVVGRLEAGSPPGGAEKT